jgi:uncharacterized membrane protein YeaQ/YmgE (transglycosylase-associated protein family)
MFIGFACWIVLGLIIGYAASKVVNLRNEDPNAGIIVGGIAGALAGWIANLSSVAGAAGFNLWSLLFAALGAIVASVAWHIVRRIYMAPKETRRVW